MAGQRQLRISRLGLCYTLVVCAVLAGAVARQLNLLMLLGSTLVGPLLFSLIYGRLTLRRLVVARKLPSQLRADQRLMVDVSVTNGRRWLEGWSIEAEDRIARESSDGGAGQDVSVGVYFPRVAARETGQITYAGRLPRRGRYRFGPLRVSTRFPFGLVRHSLVMDDRGELMVHPRLGRLTQDWIKVLREGTAGTQSIARRGLLEADFYGLRDWRPGDSRRWIHWRTSARRGSLVVRQFEQRRTQDLAVLVDLWQPTDPSPTQLENVEKAISFAATLIAETCRQTGRHLTLHVAAAKPLTGAGAASPFFFREQMDALSLVAAHQQPAFPSWLAERLAAVPRSTPTIVVSTRPIDWEVLQAMTEQREMQRADRVLRGVDVGSDALAEYFQV